MELSHSFTVPAPLDEAWATFMDLQLVGGCFPGATVTEATDEGFSGTGKMKLYPNTLEYSGSGSFVERDDTAHRAVIEAKGKDRRGNGTAGATVTIALADAGDGTTRAEVQTDLAITGKPAQFGRGVMQDVSDKLLGQFVACIEGRFSGPAEEAAPAEEQPAAEATTGPAPGVTPLRSVPDTPAAAVPAQDDGALDLGATVLPVLLRSYGKQIAAALVVLLVVVGLARRRRR